MHTATQALRVRKRITEYLSVHNSHLQHLVPFGELVNAADYKEVALVRLFGRHAAYPDAPARDLRARDHEPAVELRIEALDALLEVRHRAVVHVRSAEHVEHVVDAREAEAAARVVHGRRRGPVVALRVVHLDRVQGDVEVAAADRVDFAVQGRRAQGSPRGGHGGEPGPGVRHRVVAFDAAEADFEEVVCAADAVDLSVTNGHGKLTWNDKRTVVYMHGCF